MKETAEESIVKIEKIVLPVLKEMELELVDIEYLQEGGYWYVRIYIEKLDGDVSLDDCAKVSMAVEDDIDKLIDKKFFLEISSPGVERPLKREKDYIRLQPENRTMAPIIVPDCKILGKVAGVFRKM